MSIIKNIFGYVVVLTGAGLVIAMGTGKADADEKIIFGSGLAAPFLMYPTAVDGGVTERYGIDAEYKYFASGTDAQIAQGAGEVHVSNGSCTAPISVRASGGSIIIVARNLINPYEFKFIASEDFNGPENLKGKKIGAYRGSASEWYALRYFDKYGLEVGTGPGMVEVINIQPPEWIPALVRGDIDGFFGFEPWVTRAGQIAPTSKVAHRGAEDNVFTMMNCLTFNEDWVKRDPDGAKLVLRALIETNDIVQADKNEAVRLASGPMRIPEEDLRKMAECCTYGVDATPEFLEHVRDAAEFTKRQVEYSQSVDDMMDEVVNFDLLRDVAPERITVPQK